MCVLQMAKLHLKTPPDEMSEEELQAVDTKTMEVGLWSMKANPSNCSSLFDCSVITSCVV